MLRLATSILIRSRAVGGSPSRALVLALSTTVRGGGPEPPSNDVPPASTVAGPGPDNISRTPPQARLTGNEVEEALDPLGRVGRAVKDAVKSTAGTAAEVMSGKLEDPIVDVAERAINSVPKFERAREMQAERGKEKLAGSKYPDDIKERQMDPAGEAATRHHKEEKAAEAPLDAVVNKIKHGVEVTADKLKSALGTEGGGPEGESIVGKVAHTMGKGFSALKEGVAGAAAKVGNAAMGGQRGEESMAEAMKHAVEFGVKGVKETVAGMAEKISKTTAAREESMQAAAGRERKRRAHGEKGAEEAEVAAEKAGAGGDVRNVDTGDGRRGVPEQEGEEEGKGKGEGHPSDSVLGAPPGPKTEEEAGGQPWGRGSW